MLNVLVLGGSGLVGSVFTQYASEYFKLHLTFNTNSLGFNHANFTKLDVLNRSNVLSDLILKQSPDVVINTIALPNVDFCETNHDEADMLHVNFVYDIVNLCSQIGSKVISFSTDAVFPGKLHKKYTENDVPNPVNYYGKTRLKAEKIILDSSPKNVVLRTAVIYGWHPRSRFTNWIISSLQQNKIVDPHLDQFNTPTLVDDLAKALIKIIDQNISGLFHATGPTCINRYEFALLLSKIFKLDSSLVKPVTSQEKKQVAPRPNSTCLNSTKLENIIDMKFSDLEKGILHIYEKLQHHIL